MLVVHVVSMSGATVPANLILLMTAVRFVSQDTVTDPSGDAEVMEETWRQFVCYMTNGIRDGFQRGRRSARKSSAIQSAVSGSGRLWISAFVLLTVLVVILIILLQGYLFNLQIS